MSDLPARIKVAVDGLQGTREEALKCQSARIGALWGPQTRLEFRASGILEIPMQLNTAAGIRYLVTAGNRVLGTRAGERYRSDGQNLVLEAEGTKTKVLGPIADALATGYFRECEPLLDYPLVTMTTDKKGRIVAQRYEIPPADRAKILKQLWPFGQKPPALNAERFDLHAGKRFRVGDFLVYREEEANFLVSPYYPNGGTVIDWMPADWEKSRA
jgi:hypothetical protein